MDSTPSTSSSFSSRSSLRNNKPSTSSSSSSNTSKQHGDSLSDDRSVVEFYGYMRGYCGYCKRDGDSGGGRMNFDFRSSHLYPDDYQALLDRGWRRSGEYCYHPHNSRACCPNYPISCSALSFKFSKSLRKCVENMNSYLIHGNHRNRPNADIVKLDYQQISRECPIKLGVSSIKGQSNSKETSSCSRSFEDIKSSSKARDKRFVKSCERKMKLYNLKLGEAMEKTKERSRQRRNNYEFNLEDYLFPRKKDKNSTHPFRVRHKLDIRLVYVDALSYDAELDEHSLIKKYQKAVHKESPTNWTLDKFHDFLIDTPLNRMRMKDRDYIRPNGENLDKNLSENIYEEDEFLIVSPPPLPTHYGTYHCLYYFDGNLIAVGVLDILTKSITTVYFFYDPNYTHLKLGIYSALVEISMIRQMAKRHSGPPEKNKLIYYHIGFYVHECIKMHYKTRFKPAYLLCSETWEYLPIEACIEKLKGKKYVRFSSNNKPSIYNYTPSLEDIDKLRLITPLSKTPMLPSEYFVWLETNLSKNYVNLVLKNVLFPLSLVVGASLLHRLTVQLSGYHRAVEIDYHKKQSASKTSTSTTATAAATTKEK